MDDGNILKPLGWPPIHVDVDVSQAQLTAMLERVERVFRHLGTEDPHWSILAAEAFRKEQIGQNTDAFFLSGKDPVNDFTATLTRCGFEIGPEASCLELGCGLGRSSIWLAPLFQTVIGVDISAPHLAIAADVAREFSRHNLELRHLRRIADLASFGEFDFFFSVIVLQHNPPPVMVEMLRTILSRIKPGGLVYFQVPTYRLGYRFDAAEYLLQPVRFDHPEMHVLPQTVLHRLLHLHGFQLVEMREDGAAGGDNISSRVLAQRLT